MIKIFYYYYGQRNFDEQVNNNLESEEALLRIYQWMANGLSKPELFY